MCLHDRVQQILVLGRENTGIKKSAKEFFHKASSQEGIDNEFLYYQAMVFVKSGKKKEADRIFDRMIELGHKQLEDSGDVDFFAKFGGDLTEDQRRAISYHIMGLGYMGKADKKKASEYFSKSLDSDVNQLWSRIYLEEL